jgi:hypothetical protein
MPGFPPPGMGTAGGAARGAAPSTKRFRLTAPGPSETELHEAVADLLKVGVLLPAVWTCFPAGNVPLEPRFAAKLYRMGLQRGWPDFLVVHDGKVRGLELKKPGEQLSKSRWVRTKRGSLKYVEGQDVVHPQLMDAGMSLAVCWSIDEVIQALRFWHIPLRRGIGK